MHKWTSGSKGPYTELPSEIELGSLTTPISPAPATYEPRSSWRPRRLHGWRGGVLSGALLATVVLVINFIVTVVAMSKAGGSRKVLFQGNCHRATQLDLGVHLLINVMSTALLGASNYAMQCLTAPTRAEVDVAHATKKWLDIGVLSMRNILNIDRKRACLWALLGASSLPLHFFYNSAVFSTISAVEYPVYSVSPEMLTDTRTAAVTPFGVGSYNNGTPPAWLSKNSSFYKASSSSRYFNQTDYDTTSWDDPNSGSDTSQYPNGTYVSFLSNRTLFNFYDDAKNLYQKALAGQLDNLTVSDCINRYATTFQTAYRAVILVSEDDKNLSIPFVYSNLDVAVPMGSGCSPNAYYWICNNKYYSCLDEKATCSSKLGQLDQNDWRPLGKKVSYCLSEPAVQECKLQFTLQIAWVVIVFNAMKAVVLFLIFFTVRTDPLITIGDAISSFLQRADDTTQHLCLLSKKNIGWWKMPLTPRPYKRSVGKAREKWSNSVSTTRWATCLVLYGVALGTSLSLFGYGIAKPKMPVSTLMSLGLGAINPLTFIQWNMPSQGTSAVMANVLIANLPQVVLSAIYFTYNSLFTSFLAALEWTRYATYRRGLRVSAGPRGAQRATYFLQLPYRFALPLMVLSGVMHWLMSQSIFLVSVEEDGAEFLTCGYSPSAMLSVICVGFLMVAVVVVLGRRRFKGGMPLAATCSTAISAACHVGGDGDGHEGDADSLAAPEAPVKGVIASHEERGDETAFLPVRWGVTGSSDDVFEGKSVGHCAFSSREVTAPRDGELYAGLKRRPRTHVDKN